MTNNLLTENLSEPLNGATSAKVDIDSDIGNLAIDRLPAGGQALATGTLAYFENQGTPARTLDSINGQAIFSLKGGGKDQRWFRLPWAACKGAYDWRIHLNPDVPSDIRVHSGGGNIEIDLGGMEITHLSADTGGGNMDLILPESADSLDVAARTGGGNVTIAIGSDITGSNIVDAHSGAGNVTIHAPRGLAARIHADSGLGNVIVDPLFSKIDDELYQSPDYESADNRIEITAHSGAGNVSVSTT